MPDIFVSERSENAMRERSAAVIKQHVAATNTRRRFDAAKNLAIVGLAAGCAYLVWSNGQLAVRLAGQPVVYAVVQPNGEWIASTHYTEATPTGIQGDDVRNALWTYVQARDCYGSSSPLRQYYIALAMSDVGVGRQVREQFLLSNPAAPQHVYGEHNVTVQCDLVDTPTAIGDAANNQYLFRFRRWEQAINSVPTDQAAAPFYSVTVRFRTGIYPQDDKRRAWLDRSTFNAAGVQVIDYPGAKPTNAKPKAKL